MLFLIQPLLAFFDEPDGAGRAVFAIQLRVPAAETFFAQPDVVLQALEACFFFRMAGAFSHAAVIPLISDPADRRDQVNSLNHAKKTPQPGWGGYHPS